MKRILFYYPSNKRTVVFETLFKELKSRNYDIYLLTTCGRGELHDVSESLGVNIFFNPIEKKSTLLYYFQQIIFLIKFCKKYKIDVVASHLQHTNFISVFAQFFTKAPIVEFRHHFKFHLLDKTINLKTNKNEKFFDKVINFLAKKIVVPSSGVYDGMKNFENVNMQKVKILPYFYDFSNYSSPNLNNVNKLKSENSCKLLLLMCSRLIPFKRHLIVFETIKNLVDLGYDIKMIVLDEGPEKETLESFIKINNLEERVKMFGFRTDFVDYMFASDLLIHPSLTEASNSVVKEMGLMKKGVAVCENVGDFSDYIVNEENGFLIGLNDSSADIHKIIVKSYNDKKQLLRMGENLNTKVFKLFNVNSKHIDAYLDVLFN
jgi:glycosyltransferase involved in cell wall biosynthesis